MRRDCRETAFKIIFAELFGEKSEVQDELYGYEKLNKEDKEYTDKLIKEVKDNYEYLTQEIEKLSLNFRYDRIFAVDKAILILAMAEMKFIEDVPSVVSIKEAIELVKKYSQEDNVVFVNGILAKFKQDLEK
ncbi:MAG TPA: transcription antitermination factor NusB [Clostridiales bacterium]|nr:transcription antitermination factor NusB [Clostridiales bacterium]